MSEFDDLMSKANEQLHEHKVWLAEEISKMPANVDMVGAKVLLCEQALHIKLRVVRVVTGSVQVVYDYPDELYAFLRSDGAPKHLRESLSGGYPVSTEEPASSLRRSHEPE